MTEWETNARQRCWALQKGIGKGNLLVIVRATQMPNSNTINILVQRLRITGLCHANTNTEEGLLCYHKHWHNFKKPSKMGGGEWGGIYRKKQLIIT